MLSNSFDKSVPLRWPAAWNDPALLDVLKGSPVNCILDAPKAVADAARTRGLQAPSRAELASSIQFLADPQWPGVRARRGGGAGADAGPTGAPWVDANGWSIRLARALDPEKPIWVEAVPEKGVVQTDASYQLAVAESQAFGAHWVISLDDGFAKSLAAGDAAMKSRWGKMMETIRFFATRPAAAALQEPCASLAIISDFSGDNEFLGKEFLNMSDRRNLLYRIVPKRSPITKLPAEVASVVFVDEQAPDPQTAATLKQFANNGGLLIGSRGSGIAAWGGAAGPSPMIGYSVRTAGKGRIAVPDKAWSDPFVLASEVRVLIGRRTDVLRIYNEGMVGAVYGRGNNEGILHLVNYGRRRSSEQITIATADGFTRAQVVSLEHPTPQDLKVTARPQRFSEVPVPAFAVYSAIELRRS